MLVAGVTCVQLLLSAGTHDVLHHANPGHDHACVVCTFTHAKEAEPAVLADVIAPRTGEAERLAPQPAPAAQLVVVAPSARGPPSPRA